MSFAHFYRWIVLIVIGVALFFSCRFALAWAGYSALSGKAEGQVMEWEVLDRGARSAVRAKYSFEVGGKRYVGGYTFARDYWNEGVAAGALVELSKRAGTVFYDPKAPDCSALEREFPLGLLVRTTVCYVILGYFLFFSKKIRSIDLLR